MRRKRNYKRNIEPDIRYGSVSVAKFTNHIMERGQKNTAQNIIYAAFDVIEKKYKLEPLEAFDTAIRNASPLVEIKARRVGGATYQIPREVRGERRFALASRWIIDASRKRKGRPMAEKLAEELMAAYKNEGTAIKKKLDTHRMADANKAFAHFAW
jgi:small subunit ribosomal protein S7